MQPRRMVADIGGTNTRIALFDPEASKLRAVRTYINRDYLQLEDVIARWLADLDEPAPTACCIAVAAPLSSDRVTMVNMDWSFSRSDIIRRFGMQQAGWVNDFQANAHALPHLSGEERRLLHPGRDGATGKLAVVGPGTGLGGATLEWAAGFPHACPCEPGHMGLAFATPEERELFRRLAPSDGEIYAELLVSGPGLQRIYRGLGEVRDQQTDSALSPEEISGRALRAEDTLCTASLETFCALLGSVCGDFVLANGAYGGVYLAGGIVPRMMDFLENSAFHRRLTHKGALAEPLGDVPVHVVTAPHPGLLGAAHAPLQ